MHGYSATEAGAAFLPFTLMIGGLSRWSGTLTARIGARRPLIAGSIIAAAGYALMALPDTGGSYWTGFFPAMLVLGLGMAIAVTPLTTAVMDAVSEETAGIASGINNAAARIAGLLAVAGLGALAVGLHGSALEDRLATIDAPPEAAAALIGARHDLAAITLPDALAASLPAATRTALAGAVDAAFVDTFRILVLITAGLAFAAGLVAAFTIRSPPPGEEAGESR